MTARVIAIFLLIALLVAAFFDRDRIAYEWRSLPQGQKWGWGIGVSFGLLAIAAYLLRGVFF